MRKVGLLLFLLLTGTFLFAQKQINDANVQKRDVSAFHGIHVSSGIELILTQGSEDAVAVSASNTELRDNIKTEVSGGILKISFDHNIFKLNNMRNKKLKAYVSIREIDELHAASGSHVKAEGSIRSSAMDMEASSGAIVKGDFNSGKMKVDQSSGSIINISGSATDLEVEGSSGSIFDAYDFKTENCNAKTTSGSMVKVTVNKELSVKASSGGKISYKGNGLIRNVDTGSGGSVSRKS